jgi:hypothetical protein
MRIKTVLAGGLVAAVVALAGCGDSKKSEVPKDLDKPLPPPPVMSGGGGKGRAAQPEGEKPSAPAQADR